MWQTFGHSAVKMRTADLLDPCSTECRSRVVREDGRGISDLLWACELMPMAPICNSAR